MQFVCRVGTPDGRLVEETFQAHNEAALRTDLQRKGYQVFEVRRRGSFGVPGLPTLRRRERRVPIERLLVFNQELMALLRAGLPLLQALDLMLERQRDPEFRTILVEIREKVKSGEDLSDAVASFGEVFPPLYSATLKAGERTGELDQVLARFIRNQRLVLEARKKVITALIYPCVLVCLSIGLILVMTVFVIPKFEDFYANLETELPLITSVILAVSTFLRSNWQPTLVVLAVAAVAFLQWRRGEAARVLLDSWKLKIPLLGTIFHRMSLSEFGRSLSTLLSGGIPLVSALEICTEGMGNSYITKKVRPAIQEVREGVALNEALERTEVFPDLGIDMIKVGEATGALEAMVGNLSDFFDGEVETRMQRILGLIEPIMLVLMGIIVATLLVAVYLPMISVLKQVQ